MPAYLDSIRKGVATVMISLSSLNGMKMHVNYDLITGYLKKKLKFKVRSHVENFIKIFLFLNETFYCCPNKCYFVVVSRVLSYQILRALIRLPPHRMLTILIQFKLVFLLELTWSA